MTPKQQIEYQLNALFGVKDDLRHIQDTGVTLADDYVSAAEGGVRHAIHDLEEALEELRHGKPKERE